MWQMLQALFIAVLISGSVGYRRPYYMQAQESTCTDADVVAALRGPQGPPGPSHTIYTIWGKSACPTTPDTKLVYSGLVAKSYWNQRGGGIDYQCMSNTPQYLSTVEAGTQQARAKLIGTQFEDWVGHYNTNPATSTFEALPCAVCLAKRSTSVMIPGQYECPENFKREYYGNLGAERDGHESSSNFICLAHDRDADVPNDDRMNKDPDSSVMLAEIQGGSHLTPPYEDGKEVACVVCTI